MCGLQAADTIVIGASVRHNGNSVHDMLTNRNCYGRYLRCTMLPSACHCTILGESVGYGREDGLCDQQHFKWGAVVSLLH